VQAASACRACFKEVFFMFLILIQCSFIKP